MRARTSAGRAKLLGLIALIAILAACGVAATRQFSTGDIATVDAHAQPATQNDTIELCPWRDPEGDRKRFFPASTVSRDEDMILTRYQAALRPLLGRTPTGDEMALAAHRIYAGDRLAGTIVMRRIRGAYGVIELVVAVGADGRLRGIKVQRDREPEATSRFIHSRAFTDMFVGRDADSPPLSTADFRGVSSEAAACGAAVAESAHTTLVLLQVGAKA